MSGEWTEPQRSDPSKDDTAQDARIAALLATIVGGGSAVHAGEVQLSVYGGYNSSFSTDIKFKPNAATPTTTYKNVALDGASFEGSPLLGFQGCRLVFQSSWLGRRGRLLARQDHRPAPAGT